MIVANLAREQFEAMDDKALGAACFAPLIHAYKEMESTGGNFVKLVYNRFSKGQQALFAFWTYYSHVRESQADLYWWSAFFMANPLRWEALQASLRYFNDLSTLEIVKTMDAGLTARNHPRSLMNFDVSMGDLEQDEPLSAIVAVEYNKLLAALPGTLNLIAAHIRGHQDDFITLA
ncbi:hypothetical protein [Paenibacillus paeoniae]|uniref:Uncharacterized protein n=1 Tax=Paenibacillus paeoniae TaxID=2292705 RepID=A0A371P5D7_9BACL|nr:hypothetical protein [Paenibacillus paeoniae]REK71153.1 hypothetical protein DX130_22125 [Paenibacillus paeoniae]